MIVFFVISRIKYTNGWSALKTSGNVIEQSSIVKPLKANEYTSLVQFHITEYLTCNIHIQEFKLMECVISIEWNECFILP